MKSKKGRAGSDAAAPAAEKQPATGNGPVAGEFDAFLAELAGAVAERVKAIGSKPTLQADPVFFDESKTITEWPELSAYVIEELR